MQKFKEGFQKSMQQKIIAHEHAQKHEKNEIIYKSWVKLQQENLRIDMMDDSPAKSAARNNFDHQLNVFRKSDLKNVFVYGMSIK